MPRHGTGLGAGSFPAANKLLMRYENDRAYKLHMQKLNNVKHRLDVKEPKKQNHLILRLKQIQKEEERQAEIDHENKILLNKMTHVLKYGGNIDNWNNYESRSLNFPFRERQNEDIARENIGIARRLETVKPKLAINKWEKDYQQHQYLKRLWSDSVKDFGEFTPRRYRSRMSRTVQRSMENSLDDTYDEDFHSVDTSEDKKLPRLKKDAKRNQFRTAKSESSVPVTQKKDDSRTKASTKLPKIIPHKARSNGKQDDSKDKDGDIESDNNNKPGKSGKTDKEAKERTKEEQSEKKHKNESKKDKKPKESEERAKSSSSLQSEKYITNDLERVKTLISENQEEDESIDKSQKDQSQTENEGKGNTKDNGKTTEKDDFFDKEPIDEMQNTNLDKSEQKGELDNGNSGVKDYTGKMQGDTNLNDENGEKTSGRNGESKEDIGKQPDTTESESKSENSKENAKGTTDEEQKGVTSKQNKRKKTYKDIRARLLKKYQIYLREDGISGQAKEGRDDNSDIAQLFKIAKQLGRPEDIFIKTLIKKSHKQRMMTKAKFRQKYDLDLVSELKNGLGQPWEYLIDALLQERGVADSYAVFDALSTADMCDVVELLCSRDNATIAELKESYRKEFSISLEEDMSDRSKPPIQTVLLALQKGVRDESPDVDIDLVRKDAQAIYEYGEGCWDSDNGVFMKLLNERSYTHLQAVFTEYKTVAEGQDILHAMKKECAKDYYKILSTLVQCIGSPSSYYADQLHRHKLPTDPVLVATLALRSEIDMPEVRKVYKKMYGVDITEDIKAKSHPTQKCLIELACKVPPGSKKKADTKKMYVKDGAADQQSQPQPFHAKKPPAGKKSEPKVKGQAQSESGDAGSTKNDTETKHSKKSEPKAQQSKSKDNQDSSTKQKNSPTGARGGNHRGTVRSASNFRPEDDCDKLNSAMSGERADESVVVSIIPKRSNKQRQQLKATYEQKHKKNLTIDLTSEMTGDWEEIVLALMMTPAEYDAHVVREAVEGLGTSEPTLIAILCTRSAQELKAIKEHYRKAGGGDFDMDVTRDCGADLKNLLLHLARGERAAGTAVNIQQAQKDAKDLHQNGVLGDSFVAVVSKENHFQIKATFDEFKKVAGQDIYAAITKASLGDDEDVYISIAKAVEDPVEFYAEKLHGCFTSMGTNDNLLIRLVVPRSEVDLEDIKLRYYELYSRTLYDAVNAQCQGDYKAMLLAVINNDVNGKKDQQKKPIQQTATSSKKDNGQKPTSGATVKPAKPFNPIDDSERLNEAMSGFGTDEAAIIDVLPYRTNDQRQEIKAKYQDKYSKDLQKQLESELRGDFEEIVLAMMMKPVDYACHSLHHAVKGLGTKEGILIGVLCTKTGKELAVIKNRYKEMYGTDLQSAITQDVSGGMEEMFVEILKCEREQGDTVNTQEAKEDAKRLYKEGQISIDPTDEVFKSIIARKSRAQVRATFQEYKKLTGNDIYVGIQKALMGDEEDAYVGLARAVEDPVWFYAEAIHGCFDGFGTNDTRLIRIIVARSEVDLVDIKAKYKSLYKKTISERVEQECNGDSKKMLLAILGDHPENGGKSQQKKPAKPIASKKENVQKPTSGPTVKPANPFSPVKDSERLNGAMSGFGTDEAVIVDILPCRTNDQRQEIKAKYKDKYSKDLQEQLESELRGDFEEIVLAMMMKPVDYACHSLHEAVKGLGTKEGILIGVLCTNTGKRLTVIKNRYKEIYGTDLQLAITQDVSGGMEEMFVEILKCERDQGETVNIQEAKEDAKRLYKEGQISIDPTDEVFKSVIARKSRVQVRATFQEYKKLTGNDIYVGIQKALIGDEERAYVGLASAVEDPVWFYAEAIHGCFDGLGTNDTRLIRIIVSRSEIDLADIKTKYKSLYKKTISERIQQECNGDYKKMLLAILGDHNGNETRKNTEDSDETQNTTIKNDAKRKHQLSVVLPDPDRSETESAIESNETDSEIANLVNESDDIQTSKDTSVVETNNKNCSSENAETEEELCRVKSSFVETSNAEGANNSTNENNAYAVGKLDKNKKEKKTGIEKKNTSHKHKGQEKKEKSHTTQAKKKTNIGSAKKENNSAERKEKSPVKMSKGQGKRKSAKDGKKSGPITAEIFTQYDPSDCRDEDTVNADANEDCKQLNEALHAKRTNKETINDIFSELNENERKVIREAYQSRYDKDILEDIKHELKGPHLLLVQSMIKDQSQNDAEHLYNSVSGFGTDESSLIYLFTARSAKEISNLKKQYLKLYGREVATDVINETSGFFRKLCLALVNKTEPDNSLPEEEYLRLAEQNVDKLWKPGGKLEQDHNDRLIQALSQCDAEQYRIYSNIYLQKSGISFPEGIVRTTKGTFQEALLSLASYFACSADYHAQNIARAFKGFRNNDRLLISAILPNLENHLTAVEDAYEKRYRKTLEEAIKSNCGSGNYGQLWLKLISRAHKDENADRTDANKTI